MMKKRLDMDRQTNKQQEKKKKICFDYGAPYSWNSGRLFFMFLWAHRYCRRYSHTNSNAFLSNCCECARDRAHTRSPMNAFQFLGPFSPSLD